MRFLRSGNINIGVRATNIARLYYLEEFGIEIDETVSEILSFKNNTNLSRYIKTNLSKLGQAKTDKLINEIKKLSEDDPKYKIKITTLFNELLDSGVDVGVLLQMQEADKRASIPTVKVLQVIWAMAKAENKANGNSTPCFEQWVCDYEEFNANDCYEEFEKEIKQGFFR